jgi:hypothetical protein
MKIRIETRMLLHPVPFKSYSRGVSIKIRIETNNPVTELL